LAARSFFSKKSEFAEGIDFAVIQSGMPIRHQAAMGTSIRTHLLEMMVAAQKVWTVHVTGLFVVARALT
jgi:hypothetical protein